MIIRSQSKMTIIDTTNLVIGISCKSNTVIAYHINDLSPSDSIPLGIYSSEEKLKQVLDALCLEARIGRTFFQMPQDEEVVNE